MNSFGWLTSLTHLTQSLVHWIPNSVISIQAIWAVTVENDGDFKAARKDMVEIVHDNQALSGWCTLASH
jgi:hypothetical protein